MSKFKGKPRCPLKTHMIIWKTIKIGTKLRTATDFRKAFQGSGVSTAKWADSIFDSSEFKVAERETELDLVKITLSELGLKENARRGPIYERAKESGLLLCPLEAGFQLCLQHRIDGESLLLMGMEPIWSGIGHPRILGIRQLNAQTYIYCHIGGNDLISYPTDKWIFVQPRQIVKSPARENSPAPERKPVFRGLRGMLSGWLSR